jgi:transposase
MRPVSVFANSLDEAERLRAELRGRWRLAVRVVMVLLSLQGLPAAQIAGLLECHPATVRRWIGRFSSEGLAGLADRPRCGRPPVGGRRLSRRIAALLERPGPWTVLRIWRHLGRPQVSTRTLYRRVRQVAEAFPRAPVIVVICDNDSIHHARAVTRYLDQHPRLELLYGARYSPHDNPVERIWAGLKNYVANTAVSWPGRLRQIHAFFRNRSPSQMLATGVPLKAWTL